MKRTATRLDIRGSKFWSVVIAGFRDRNVLQSFTLLQLGALHCLRKDLRGQAWRSRRRLDVHVCSSESTRLYPSQVSRLNSSTATRIASSRSMQATLRTHYLPEPHYHGPFTTSRSALPTDKLDLPSHRRRNDLCAPPGILRHLRPLQYLVRFLHRPHRRNDGCACWHHRHRRGSTEAAAREQHYEAGASVRDDQISARYSTVAVCDDACVVWALEPTCMERCAAKTYSCGCYILFVAAVSTMEPDKNRVCVEN